MSRALLPNLLEPPRLPSIETQTVAFVEAARARNRRGIVSCRVEWRGFNGYLRYCRNMPMGTMPMGEVLVIATVEIPEELQRRGWFLRYCQLCCALVEHGVVIESVVNPELEEALTRRPAFKRIGSNTFYLEKRGWGDWPLSLLPGEAASQAPDGGEPAGTGDDHGH